MIFEFQVGELGRILTLVEVKIRILIERHNNGKKVSALSYSKLLKLPEGYISPFSYSEIQKLEAARLLRNSIMHGNFDEAIKKLTDLGYLPELNKAFKFTGFGTSNMKMEVLAVNEKSDIFDAFIQFLANGHFELMISFANEVLALINVKFDAGALAEGENK